MKRVIFILIFALTYFLSVGGVFAADQIEKIESYTVDITVRSDGKLDVIETIVYDFGDQERHGIYRDIPLGGYFSKYRLAINNISVTDEANNDYNFDTTQDSGMVEIKIGDADTLITGQHIYILQYEVDNGLRFFSDHVELYWNAIGDQWPVAIDSALVNVHLPAGIDRQVLQYECFQGVYGSKQNCPAVSLPDDGNSTMVFEIDSLLPNEGATVVVGMPRGYIQEPAALNEVVKYVIWLVELLLLPFLVTIFLLLRWRKSGRDPQGRGTIITQFSPPDDIQPAAMGVVVDEYVKPKYFSAEIIYFAVNGYLKIVKAKKSWLQSAASAYTLVRLQKSDQNLTRYQQLILGFLFQDSTGGQTEVKLSELGGKLKTSASEKIKKITEELYDHVVAKEYFVGNPEKTRQKYYLAGGISLFVGFGSIFFFSLAVILLSISLILSGVACFVAAYLMPVKTKHGVSTLEHILGFKRYLDVAEKDRLTFHNAPEKNPETFDAFLPYAMVLGVEKAWAKQFESIYQTPPNWYSDTTGTAFNSSIFVGNLNSFNTQSMGLFSSSSSGGSGLGGGGSSGGGGGGGGGGSW